ncbi:hypothetical protein V1281_004625 [Nitrobacteraceae bacterium AZCC 2161]
MYLAIPKAVRIGSPAKGQPRESSVTARRDCQSKISVEVTGIPESDEVRRNMAVQRLAMGDQVSPAITSNQKWGADTDIHVVKYRAAEIDTISRISAGQEYARPRSAFRPVTGVNWLRRSFHESAN